MTTIAIRQGVFAADRLCTSDRKITTSKIIRHVDRELGPIVFAMTGDHGQCVRFRLWILGGRKGRAPGTKEADAMVAIRDTQTIELWDASRGVLVRTPVRDRFWSIGSGSQYAMGAMECGFGARTAVKIAARRDPGTGQGVDSVRVWR
jgi:hypothetical protein